MRYAFRPAAAALLLTISCLAQAVAQHAAGAHDTSAAVTIGTIEIAGAFTRATLPNAPVAGGYLTLTNFGADDDILTGASADFARDTQLHEMALENDIMRMRELTDGIAIPAGQTVVLEPGGLHLMFMGLIAPLVEGEVVEVTLEFDHAGMVTIAMPVGTIAAGAAGHSDHGHAEH